MRDCRSVPTFLRDAFPWGKVVRLKPDRMRGGRQYRFLCRGGGMPRCARILYAEIARYNLLPPSDEGGGSAPAETEGVSYPRSRGERFLRKAFSPGRRCHAFWRDGCGIHRCTGQSGNLYRVPSTPGPFGTTFPQGMAFLCPGSLYVDFCRSDIESRRAGHAAAPTRETKSLLLGAAYPLSHGLRHDSPLL